MIRYFIGSRDIGMTLMDAISNLFSTKNIQHRGVNIGFKRLESVDDTMQRYQLVKRTIVKHSKNIDARCETLERTARLQHLGSTQKDYRELEIPKGNTIILADIPYKATAGYLNDFDHEAFYEWALAQKHPVFICEYDMPTPPFTLIDQTLKNSQLSATTTKKATEKLFACNLTDQIEGQMRLF